MPEFEERTDREDETGYADAVDGVVEDAPEDQPQAREPASDEEAAQGNYANTDDEAS